MQQVHKHVQTLRASGYSAVYTLPIFLVVAIIAVWINATHLHWLGLAHVFVLAKLVLLLGVHELLRPFCLSFAEVCTLTAHVGAAANTAIFEILKRRGQPKFQEWTLWYEGFQAIAFAAGQRNGGHIIKRSNIRAFRRNFDLVGRLLGAFACWRHATKLTSFSYNNLEHLWVGSKDCTSSKGYDRRVVILYFHGGGYALFSPHFFVAFASRLLSHLRPQLQVASKMQINVEVLLANYRKLPEVSFPTPLNDAMTMFDYLVTVAKVAPENIILAGDSAGAGLVLATLLRLRRAHRAMPLAALCSCPYVDVSANVAVSEHCFISKSMLDAIRDLCVLESPRAAWDEGAMAQTDWRGLPSLFIQTAEFDILHTQSLQLAEKARADGVDVELDVNAHMPHVFTLFPPFMIPHSSTGIKRLAAFIAQQLTTYRSPVQLPRAAPAF